VSDRDEQAPARRPLWQRVVQLLLPPVLAAGAMGVHWWLNVPDKIIESPNDQGSKDKKPDKKKKEARERKGRNALRDEARTSEEFEADGERYGTLPFEQEPTRTAWARRNQVVINRAVVEARRVAFEGAPEEADVVLASTTCRRVCCRFVLRSPHAHELERMRAALERLESAGEPLWRSFESEPAPPAADPKRPDDQAQHRLQITAAFQTDEVDAESLAVPSEEPGEPGDPGEPDEPGEPGDPEPGEPNDP
jgi:hypothetical protein